MPFLERFMPGPCYRWQRFLLATSAVGVAWFLPLAATAQEEGHRLFGTSAVDSLEAPPAIHVSPDTGHHEAGLGEREAHHWGAHGEEAGRVEEAGHFEEAGHGEEVHSEEEGHGEEGHHHGEEGHLRISGEEGHGEGHGEQGHHHGHHGHHGPPQGQELAVGGMLLGCVVFNMLIFYAVNHPDPDMKYYSWEILSKTIAIFVSVLLFEGYSGIFKSIIREAMIHEGPGVIVPWNRYYLALAMWGLLNIVVWILAFQLVIRCFSKVPGSGSDQSDMSPAPWYYSLPLACPHTSTECRFKAWVEISAHIAAFAVIRCGRDMQKAPIIQNHPWLVPVPLLLVMSFVLLVLQKSPLSVSKLDTATSSDHEEGEDAVVDEEGIEAENEILGLSMSNLTAEAIMVLTSAATGQTGHAEHYGHVNNWLTMVLAYVFAGVCLGITVSLVYRHGVEQAHEQANTDEVTEELHAHHLHELLRHRLYFVLQMTTAMCASWLILDASAHFMLHLCGHALSHHSTIFNVIEALAVSFVTFTAVWALDKIHDLDETGELADKCIVCIIHALAILIGFTWEEAFHACFTTTAHVVPEEIGWLLPFVGAVGIAAVVVPAWRAYILKKLMALQEEAELEEQRHELAHKEEAAREIHGGRRHRRGRAKARKITRSRAAALESTESSTLVAPSEASAQAPLMAAPDEHAPRLRMSTARTAADEQGIQYHAVRHIAREPGRADALLMVVSANS